MTKKILSDINSQEHKTVNLLHLSSIDVDREVHFCVILSKISDFLMIWTLIVIWYTAIEGGGESNNVDHHMFLSTWLRLVSQYLINKANHNLNIISKLYMNG